MVCRLFGTCCKIRWIWGSKPMSNIRSASSKTWGMMQKSYMGQHLILGVGFDDFRCSKIISSSFRWCEAEDWATHLFLSPKNKRPWFLWPSSTSVQLPHSIHLRFGVAVSNLRIYASHRKQTSTNCHWKQNIQDACTWRPSNKSFKRPGQAMMLWTPWRYLFTWSHLGAPPYMETSTYRQVGNLPNPRESWRIICEKCGWF